ncbi:MAG: metallophosphatase domain-containing protein [Rhodobacteraceae bacterium]|nr:metallophosphatase domain-containing protein [Paracoccaceae bacterium]
MKIVALSDIHNDYSMSIPDGDVVIFAGDMSYIGEEKDLIRFNEWFKSLPHKHKLYIPGNHDYLFETAPSLAQELVGSGTYLHTKEITTIEGVTFYGSPYTPIFSRWAFMMTPEELMHHWSTVPQVDVLVTHGPPKNILDANLNGEPCGCPWLAYEIMNRIKPEIHIFGHIHEGYGTTTIGDTRFYNVSIMNRFYNPVNPVTIIDFEKE